MTPCLIIDLGLVGYAGAFALQKRLVAARKMAAIDDVLLLCEHPHVITLGRSGKREHLLASDRVLRQKGVEFHATDRGGDITYHGPGQLVGYPILNLGAIRRDVGWYVRMLEEAMIGATRDFGILAEREPGKTGIWVAGRSEKKESAQSTQRAQSSQSGEEKSSTAFAEKQDRAEKLGAIGVHLSRWVTSHGFAYNVSTDLRYFDLIVPCGISDRKATSLEKILARRVDRHDAAARLATHFGEVLGLEMIPASRDELFERLHSFEQQPVAIPA
jgi:lipoyl(octanoyl) transferase